MKRISIFTTIFLLIWNCYGQDTIIEKNKEVLLVKILEVSSQEVKYVFPDKINGPTYIENRYEISLIKYQNGIVDDFRNDTLGYDVVKNSNFPYNVDTIGKLRHSYFYKGEKINKFKINSLMIQNAKPDQLRIKKYALKAQRFDKIGTAAAIGTAAFGAISFASIFAAAVATAYESNSGETFGKVSGVCFIGAFATFNLTLICKSQRNTNTHRAIKYFNNSF